MAFAKGQSYFLPIIIHLSTNIGYFSIWSNYKIQGGTSIQWQALEMGRSFMYNDDWNKYPLTFITALVSKNKVKEYRLAYCDERRLMSLAFYYCGSVVNGYNSSSNAKERAK